MQSFTIDEDIKEFYFDFVTQCCQIFRMLKFGPWSGWYRIIAPLRSAVNFHPLISSLNHCTGGGRGKVQSWFHEKRQSRNEMKGMKIHLMPYLATLICRRMMMMIMMNISHEIRTVTWRTLRAKEPLFVDFLVSWEEDCIWLYKKFCSSGENYDDEKNSRWFTERK